MTSIRLFDRLLCGVVLLSAVAAVTGCEDRSSRPVERATETGPGSAAPVQFRFELTDDVSGYYMPVADYRVGNWVLRSIFIGQVADFADWEAGRRSATFAPVMLEFEDVTSPVMTSESGEGHAGQIRVLPSRYMISEDAVIFEGQDQVLGRITLAARLDLDGLATSRRNLGSDEPVLEGRLGLDGRNIETAGFRWWAGD